MTAALDRPSCHRCHEPAPVPENGNAPICRRCAAVLEGERQRRALRTLVRQGAVPRRILREFR